MDRIKKTLSVQMPRFSRRKAAVGAPPGTLNEEMQVDPPVIQMIAYGPGQLVEKEVATVAEAVALRDSHPVLWINVDCASHAPTLRDLGEHFSLHSLALEDVMNVHQRPKVEDYADQIFAVMRMPTLGDTVQLEQLSLFFGPGWVITVQERPGDCFEPIRNRIREGRGRIRGGGADYLAYAVIDTIVDGYFPIVEHFDDALEEIEDRVHLSPGPKVASDIHEVRQSLHSLRRQLFPTREALGLLARTDAVEVAPDTRIFLRDCQDHAARLLDAVDSSRDFCSSLMDLYLSGSGHRMNEVMKVLTIIATLFMPLGFIAGVYGMNFDASRSPWNMPELSWTFGYLFALGLMAATSIALLFFFWRKGWLSRQE